MKYLVTLILFLALNLQLFAQNTNQTVQWEFSQKKTAVNEYELHFKAKVQPGWYVYSQYLESDDGPIRTEIVYEQASDTEKLGKSSEKGEMIDGYDDMFDMNIKKFKKELHIIQKIRTELKTISGYVTFMTCNDESCLPPSDVPFRLELK
jgi:thiol:disulfide interchange protein DsbD